MRNPKNEKKNEPRKKTPEIVLVSRGIRTHDHAVKKAAELGTHRSEVFGSELSRVEPS